MIEKHQYEKNSIAELNVTLKNIKNAIAIITNGILAHIIIHDYTPSKVYLCIYILCSTNQMNALNCRTLATNVLL